MRITAAIFTLCFIWALCLPALAAEPATGNGESSRALETLIRVNEEARELHKKNKSSEAESILKKALEEAEAAIDAPLEETIYAKVDLGIIYADTGQLEKALDVFNSALTEGIAVLGSEHELTASIKAIRIGVYLRAGNLESAHKLANDAVVAATEVLSENVQAMTMFQHAFTTGLTGSREKAAFFAKIWAGMESFNRNVSPALDSGLDSAGILKEMEHDMKLPLDSVRAVDLLSKANAPGDTLYNKGKSIMSERESVLYESFGRVAPALRGSDKNNGNKDKLSARQEFHDWLAKVDAAF